MRLAYWAEALREGRAMRERAFADAGQRWASANWHAGKPPPPTALMVGHPPDEDPYLWTWLSERRGGLPSW